MESTLSSEIATSVLRQLHAQASREDAGAKERVRLREAKLGRRLDPAERYELYGDAPLAITREVGHLYYLMAGSSRVRSVVEFGASHGISTIYLAAALRDTGGGGIISTEILPRKAKMARHNLSAVDLGDLVELRVGDALQTLQQLTQEVDLLVLDGRNDQYVAVLELLRPNLAHNALVVADLGKDDPDLLRYQQHVRDPGRGVFFDRTTSRRRHRTVEEARIADLRSTIDSPPTPHGPRLTPL